MNFPPVTCIVSDLGMSFTHQVSEELDIPNVGFWASSCGALLSFIHYPKLVHEGYFPLKGTTKFERLPPCILEF